MENKWYLVDTDKENEELEKALDRIIYSLTEIDKDTLIIEAENEDCQIEYVVEKMEIIGNDMYVVGVSGNGREHCEFFNETDIQDLIDWLLENICFEYLGQKYKLKFYKD